MIVLDGLCSGGLKGLGTQILRKCWLTTPRSEEYQYVAINMLMYGQFPVATHGGFVMLAPWIFLRVTSTTDVEFAMAGILIFVWSVMSLGDDVCRAVMA
jgi:hypothetical protein